MASMHFKSLAIDNVDDLLFGRCPKPLTVRSGMVIGGGQVFPELNFTLPAMEISESTMPRIRTEYREIAGDALRRAAELYCPGVQLEFETLPPMTENPRWGIELTEIILEEMEAAKQRHGLRSVLRITPNDNRDWCRPPQMRGGKYFDAMMETFEGCAAAGAELLSIESIGGKEIHDEALMMGDIGQIIFALCIMGERDMRFLWSRLVEIAGRHNAIAAGDTACGFGNTAMVLAEQKMIPRVLAAVVRPLTAVRSLVAYEVGAVGPGKDCGYENPILKAITGFPMAMEGKTSACAHLSPLGNIASAYADLWSNESVQNLMLLGAKAPTCFMEQLVYDCRLMNEALHDGCGCARQLRDWLVRSDARFDPQAYVLTPQATLDFARLIVEADTHYHAGRAVVAHAIEMLREGIKNEAVIVAERELPYLDRMQDRLEALPDDEDEFIEEMMEEVDVEKFRPVDYDLKGALA